MFHFYDVVLHLNMLLNRPFFALECIDYTNITDPTRSVLESSESTGTVLCDWNEDFSVNKRWFRLVISMQRIPEYCPPKYACNTHAAGWLNGNHPAVEDGIIQRKVCFHWSSSCCYRNIDISVRNCTTFFVYQATVPYCHFRICGKLICQFE